MRRKIIFIIIGGGFLLILASVSSVAVAVHLENDDQFCADCHTQPETTFFQRSIAELPVDLASAHAQYQDSVRCIDCHSGQGNEGRLEAVWLGAQDLVAYISGDYADPAVTTHYLGDEPCLKCHQQPEQVQSIDIEAQPNIIATNTHYHWQEYTDAWLEAEQNEVGSCSTCHVSHNENTLAALGFRHMPSVNNACDDCHQALSGNAPIN